MANTYTRLYIINQFNRFNSAFHLPSKIVNVFVEKIATENVESLFKICAK